MNKYHVLFNRKGGTVEQWYLNAPDFETCETFFLSLCATFYIDVEYWEIGVPEDVGVIKHKRS